MYGSEKSELTLDIGSERVFSSQEAVMLLVSTMNFTLWSVSNQKAVVLILMFISDWLRIQMNTLCMLKNQVRPEAPILSAD